MKGKEIVCTLMAAGLICGVPQAVFADYVSIEHNLIDGVNDTMYDAGTGLLTADSDSPLLTLNDPGPLGGTVSNVTVHLETYFDSYNPITGVAKFKNGSLSLTFDYDDDGVGPNPATSHAIGGPVAGMEFVVTFFSPTFSTIDGEGLWRATTADLPGSNNWPDGGGFSSIDSLTLAFGVDLSGFDWTWSAGGTVGPGILETTYSLLPNDSAVPEPGTMILLAGSLTGLVLKRRRRT